MKARNKDRVIIFDTTLRDGEQAPGCSMTLDEKLRVSAALHELNVDVIEAGFPAASLGDFDAVQAISESIKGPTICALARCNETDIEFWIGKRSQVGKKVPKRFNKNLKFHNDQS